MIGEREVEPLSHVAHMQGTETYTESRQGEAQVKVESEAVAN